MIFFGHVICLTFGSPLRRPKRRPRGPKTPSRAPQGAPRGRQERPRSLQEGLKSAQGGSKRALRVAKLHPRCLAKMPCRELTNGHAESSRAGGGVPPKGKAIRRPQRSGGVNGVSDSEVTSAQVQVVEYLWSYSLFLCPQRAFEARS